ncbi:MAG: hypothetical protein J6T25_02485 [Bacilli bacterium]|nr:hypothetical protein [Bacilli bacterium]
MKLGLKGKILIGVMAASLVGGVGSAFALTRTGASGAGRPGAFDGAIYLYWGSESTTATINNVENLSAGVAQYRGLEVTPKSSKSVAGNVRLTFTLAATAGDHHIKGLTVSVYKINAAFDAEHVADQIEGKVAAPVLNESNLTGTTDLAVAASENVHETPGHYAIEVVWTGANDGEHPSYTLDGSITISQSFIAA